MQQEAGRILRGMIGIGNRRKKKKKHGVSSANQHKKLPGLRAPAIRTSRTMTTDESLQHDNSKPLWAVVDALRARGRWQRRGERCLFIWKIQSFRCLVSIIQIKSYFQSEVQFAHSTKESLQATFEPASAHRGTTGAEQPYVQENWEDRGYFAWLRYSTLFRWHSEINQISEAPHLSSWLYQSLWYETGIS